MSTKQISKADLAKFLVGLTFCLVEEGDFEFGECVSNLDTKHQNYAVAGNPVDGISIAPRILSAAYAKISELKNTHAKIFEEVEKVISTFNCSITYYENTKNLTVFELED